MIPYDPTRQKYTNDFNQADIERDRQARLEAEVKGAAYPSSDTSDKLGQLFDQRRDRKQMADEDVARARDLIHAYGDARVRTYDAAPYPVANVSAAVAADAFAKLMILVEALAKGAYE